MARPERRDDGFFLPDLCGVRAVFGLVVLTELFALILATASAGLTQAFWINLALKSLFMQWSGLIGSLLLCLFRPQLRRLGDVVGGTLCWGILIAVVGGLSVVAQGLQETGFIDSDPARSIGRDLLLGAVVSGLVLRYFYVMHQWQLQVRSEGEARLQALQARIRPHFLFNSMNTIASLTRSDPILAERVVEDLADLFRASIAKEMELVPLSEELALTRRYLDIEQLRLGPRLRVAWEVAEGIERVLVPPLTLQPLVENAVYHGIEPCMDGGEVVIRVTPQGRGVLITIDNPLPAPGATSRAGNRIALENIRDRLAAIFSAEARLRASAEQGRYRVELTLPRREGGT